MTEKKGAEKIYREKKELVVNNFLGGIAWGLGSVIGATIIAIMLALLIQFLGGIPFIGRWMAEIKKAVDEAYFSLPK